MVHIKKVFKKKKEEASGLGKRAGSSKHKAPETVGLGVGSEDGQTPGLGPRNG